MTSTNIWACNDLIKCTLWPVSNSCLCLLTMFFHRHLALPPPKQGWLPDSGSWLLWAVLRSFYQLQLPLSLKRPRSGLLIAVFMIFFNRSYSGSRIMAPASCSPKPQVIDFFIFLFFFIAYFFFFFI